MAYEGASSNGHRGDEDELGSSATKAHFVLVPLMYQGHVIPAVDTALLLATHGALASVVATPYNAARIRPTIDFARQSGLPVRLVELPLDCAAVGLPEGADNVEKIPPELHVNYFDALALLAAPLERHLRAHPPYPTCIVSDFCHAWTVGVAASLDVPRLTFFSMCAFCLLCQHNVERFNAYDGVADDNEPVVVPGLEQKIEVTRAQAPGFFRAPGFEQLADAIERARAVADGVVMNSFLEMEPEYVAGYAAARKMKVWTIGPVSLYHRHAATLAARGNTASATADECIRWLDGKEPGSVVYVSFGSIAHADPKQVLELGHGLEASGHPFVWVLKNPGFYGEAASEFLEGLEERVAGRGMLIKGWAPQVLILSHAAVGGFVTHCGWNSTLEGIAAGLPLVTWPHFSDQFLNEKLAVEVLGVGVSIGVKEPLMWQVAQKEIVVGKEAVEAAVRSIMDGGDEGEERRRKALALSEKAKAAVQDGGSSLSNLLNLIKRFEVVDVGGRTTTE